MQNNRGRFIGRLISGLVMAAAVANLPAAARQEEPAPVPDAPTTTSTPDNPQPPSTPQADESSIRFTPTEKIRADDAVPFPVDI